MRDVLLTIKGNVKVGKDIYLMRLEGDISEVKRPGEFINIQIPGFYLRRLRSREASRSFHGPGGFRLSMRPT